MFVQDLNPMTGKCEWQVMSEDYDYQQEVARAGFADMLHDSERNRLYYDGLRSAVRLLRSKGEPVHVLDIGTGTGLLSMMAAALGADSVTAVEEFKPMAACAKEVMALNGFADKIRLIRKRSTEVEVGEGKDMRRRANLLVTEVFDTELIGEGAVGTYNHAHKHLLTVGKSTINFIFHSRYLVLTFFIPARLPCRPHQRSDVCPSGEVRPCLPVEQPQADPRPRVFIIGSPGGQERLVVVLLLPGPARPPADRVPA